MKEQGTNIKAVLPITKQRALAIAEQAVKSQSRQVECFSSLPERCALYGTIPDEPCWYVYAPWDDGLLALRSSRVIVISRLTGKIILDGSAGDEG